MTEPPLTYFTCTLGQAARWNESHPHAYRTVSDLVDIQAKAFPQQLAVYFPGNAHGEGSHENKSDFSYLELADHSIAAAVKLDKRIQETSHASSNVVGLLCASTPEFLLTWLGLMRLGKSVMLLAPQLEDAAVKHLCRSLDITVLFVDSRYHGIAGRLGDELSVINLTDILLETEVGSRETLPENKGTPEDVAFLFHTSGTSSGLPKSIPQTHHAAVGVLPSLPDGQNCATFSTTPLYHGGIADCLRAWASGASIHLFPGTLPITPSNIYRAVDEANTYFDGKFPARYFASVPYILQMLVADKSEAEGLCGLKLLQGMHLVSVGGAALPEAFGDELVSHNVNLVSRFGSAECGFLLSSQREYAADREWSWLRADHTLQPDFYDFEPQERQEGTDDAKLFEFVIKPRWPHRAKTNRSDGSFASADLFEKHPTIANAWRYHSRADAQITLLNGKKFDPAPLEGELLASLAGKEYLTAAMIFGSGRDIPGLLLIAREAYKSTSEAELVQAIWPTIEGMNKHTQNHARISGNNIVIIGQCGSAAAELPKSSKGTILRRQAEALLAADIDRAYRDDASSEVSELEDVADEKVPDVLGRLFEDVLGRPVDPDRDLFVQGVDSIACVQLRKRISRILFPSGGPSLPLNIIYDQGSVSRIAKYILQHRNQTDEQDLPPTGSDGADGDAERTMLDLVEKYRVPLEQPTAESKHDQSCRVVMTGATGLLGAHILDALLQDPSVEQVFCLVRAKSPDDARTRVLRSLEARELGSARHLQQHSMRIVCLSAVLHNERLGLQDAEWKRVADTATSIIHAAWPVNFTLRLQSFEDQFAGLKHLLHLRNASRNMATRLLFVSSTAAVSAVGSDSQQIAESLSADPRDASSLGYSRSKWVAENICASSARSASASAVVSDGPNRDQNTTDETPIIVVRVGQLCGNSRGIWNMTEAYPLMLSSARITRCLPLLNDPICWLPVDKAAQAIIELSTSSPRCITDVDHTNGPETPVYHVLNRHEGMTWSEAMDLITRKSSCNDAANTIATSPDTIELVDPSTWLQRLEEALNIADHPSRALLHFWKSTYGGKAEPGTLTFSTARAEGASQTMRDLQAVSGDAFQRMWTWVTQNHDL